MIVAAGTGDGAGSEGASDGIELLVRYIGSELGFVLLIESFGTDGEKAGGGQQTCAFGLILGGK